MIPGLGRCPGVGNGNPLQYSCLENSTDRGVCHSPWGHKISNTTEQMRQKHENTPSTINRILFLFFSEGTPPRPKDREDKRESHFCLFKLRKVFARVYFVSKRSNQQIHLSGHQEAVLDHQVRTIALCVLLMLFQNPVLLQSC